MTIASALVEHLSATFQTSSHSFPLLQTRVARGALWVALAPLPPRNRSARIDFLVASTGIYARSLINTSSFSRRARYCLSYPQTVMFMIVALN